MKLALVLCLLLAGCASPKFLENRVACTASGEEAHIVSLWGAFGISARLAAADAAVVCKGKP
jgi:hypothetical protein